MGRVTRWIVFVVLGVAAVASFTGCRSEESLAPDLRASANGSGSTPAAPSNANAVAASFSQVNLSWQDNSSNETGFELHSSTTGPSGAFTLSASTGANLTSYSHGGLTGSTQYCYKVRAIRTTGSKSTYSSFSNVACATTSAAPVPAAPTGARAAPEFFGLNIAVTWVDNSSDETGFRVERSGTSAGPWTAAGTTVPNATLRTDQAPPAEQSVCYRVLAFNVYGDSPGSSVACTAAPAAPTNLAASVSGANVDLTWTDNSAVEDGFAMHRWTAGGSISVVATLPANATGYRDLGLADSTYYYQVRGTKDGGQGGASNNVSAVVVTTPPSAPTVVDAVPLSSSVIYTSWTDASANEAGFRVERSTDGGASWPTAFTLGPDATEFWDTGLSSEQQLCYRVVAFNSLGEAPPSNPECTTPPAGPTDLVATSVDSITIDFAWTDNSAVEDGFLIAIAYDAYYWETVAWVGPNTTSYRLQWSYAYYNNYVVVALKDGGYSDWSDQVMPTPSGASSLRSSVTRSPSTLRVQPRNATEGRDRP